MRRSRASLPALNPPLSTPAGVIQSAKVAAVSMVARQAAVHALTLVTSTLLARWLSPAEFGVYGIVTFLLTFLTATSDVGLGAGLVRQPREPEPADLQAVMAVQHTLTLALGAALWLGAPALQQTYRLPAEASLMFRILAFAVPITAFQTVSSIRLERHLAFPRLAAIEVCQAIAYNAVLLTLVVRGDGIRSFALALLTRSIVGAVLSLRLSPWPIGWRWDWPRVRRLLRFGLPYQGVSLVSLVKDSIMPGLIATMLGAAALGQINWAVMVSSYPVLALFAMQRVYLPSFARLQEHPEHLPRVIENVIRLTNALVAPLAVLTLALVEPLTHVVFGDKWLPALPLFYLFWCANLFVPTATPLLGLLNALGRSRIAFGFAVLWAAVTWLLGAPGVWWLGTIGFAAANVAVQLTNLWLFRIAQAQVPFRIVSVIGPAWAVALVMGALVFWAARALPPTSLPALAVFGVGGLALYAGGIALVSPRLVAHVLSLRGGLLGPADLGGR